MGKYLSPYWATFEGKPAGCVEAYSKAEAQSQAEAVGKVRTLDCLPYPAEPRISEAKSDCPPFCYSPAQCKGRTACPKDYACSE